jgi:hypothetical protein
MALTPDFNDMARQISEDYKTCRFYSAHDKEQLESSLVDMWSMCLALTDVTTNNVTTTHPMKVKARKDILRWF